VWRGLRVTNSQRYTACNGRNGFKYGVLSGPNVAYSLEIGAAQKNTNYISITVPNTQAKMSVLSFYATAAWEVSSQGSDSKLAGFRGGLR
jgi:hypothetical protein